MYTHLFSLLLEILFLICIFVFNEIIKLVKSLHRVRLFATPWTVAHQAPPSMGFSRQESWSGLPFPSPGDLPNLSIKPRIRTQGSDPGVEPGSPALQADALTQPH